MPVTDTITDATIGTPISVEFEEAITVGEYGNGMLACRHWANVGVGGKVITGLTPGPTGSGAGLRNGAQKHFAFVNGSSGQALDGRGGGFVPSFGFGVGDRLMPGETLLVFVSADPPHIPANNRVQYLERFITVTGVAFDPEDDEFAPGVVPVEGMPAFRFSDINKALVIPDKGLTMPGNWPSLAAIEAKVRFPFFECRESYTTYNLMAWRHHEWYGRDFARNAGERWITLLGLDEADTGNKDTLLCRGVQRGIDLFSLFEAGLIKLPNGGQSGGRKLDIVMAGHCLGYEPMITIAQRKGRVFAEDGQTFVVEGSDVGRPLQVNTTSVVHAATTTTVDVAQADNADHSPAGWINKTSKSRDRRNIRGCIVSLLDAAGEVIETRRAATPYTLQSGTYDTDDAIIRFEVESAWSVTPTTANRVRVEGYQPGDVGMAEWGLRNVNIPNLDNPAFSASYRDLAANPVFGCALAVGLAGREVDWGWPASIIYQVRVRNTGTSLHFTKAGANGIPNHIYDFALSDSGDGTPVFDRFVVSPTAGRLWVGVIPNGGGG